MPLPAGMPLSVRARRGCRWPPSVTLCPTLRGASRAGQSIPAGAAVDLLRKGAHMTKHAVRTGAVPRPEAQPYREGAGFSIRVRYKGSDIYLSGYKTAAAAQTHCAAYPDTPPRQAGNVTPIRKTPG